MDLIVSESPKGHEIQRRQERNPRQPNIQRPVWGEELMAAVLANREQRPGGGGERVSSLSGYQLL